MRKMWRRFQTKELQAERTNTEKLSQVSAKNVPGPTESEMTETGETRRARSVLQKMYRRKWKILFTEKHSGVYHPKTKTSSWD